MKFLSVRELRSNSARVWRELSEEKEMVVTNNGRPVAVLAAVDGESLEPSLAAWRQVRAARALAEIQRASAARGTDRLSIEEIDAEIHQYREERRREK